MSILQIQLDAELKNKADLLFKNLGLDTNTAIKMFLKQAILKSAIPFEISLNNEDKQLCEIADKEYKKYLEDGQISYSSDEVFQELGI